jgi:maltooligosyltrehalose synthase
MERKHETLVRGTEGKLQLILKIRKLCDHIKLYRQYTSDKRMQRTDSHIILVCSHTVRTVYPYIILRLKIRRKKRMNQYKRDELVETREQRGRGLCYI